MSKGIKTAISNINSGNDLQHWTFFLRIQVFRSTIRKLIRILVEIHDGGSGIVRIS